MMMRPYHRGMRSDALAVSLLLCLSGGLQDAYTYLCRGKVFANAETGNIVLLGCSIAEGRWNAIPHYLLPILAFSAGVLLAESVRYHYGRMAKIRWQQIVLLLEIVILGIVGTVPQTALGDMVSNAMVSFSCAMQVDSFRTIRGEPYASTMCIGDLRSAMDALAGYCRTRERTYRRRCSLYLSAILSFLGGAALGDLVILAAGRAAVWACCGILLLVFLLLSIHPDKDDRSDPTQAPR